MTADPRLAGLPRLVLGGGSNLLLTRDFDGLAIKVEVPGLRELGEAGDAWHLEVGAGENWHATVERLLAMGRPGLENLALIPGSCGAAPIQNIGAYGLELAQRFDSLAAWDFASQRLVRMTAAECAFGYRDSLFKHALAGAPPDPLGDARVAQAVAAGGRLRGRRPGTEGAGPEGQGRGATGCARDLRCRGGDPAPQAARPRGHRQRRQLLQEPGRLVREEHQALIARHPSLVGYPQPGGRVKLAAGWLIEAVGLKGATRGRAGVYEKQALVLVNRGGATGAEILAMAREVQDKVAEAFGVWLEPEPVIV